MALCSLHEGQPVTNRSAVHTINSIYIIYGYSCYAVQFTIYSCYNILECSFEKEFVQWEVMLQYKLY